MITIIIYGLDQFVVGDLSKEMTSNIAKLYEVNDDEVNFVAPNNMVFHNGVEQTSWNVLIHIHAPMKVSVLQDLVKDYIFKAIGDLAINKVIEFYYYSQDNRFVCLNNSYPRYLTDENTVEVDNENDYQNKVEGEGEDDIYTGDIFECDDDDCHHHHNN